MQAASPPPELLNRKRLATLLQQFGEYPAKYRLMIWGFLLELPHNQMAFQVGMQVLGICHIPQLQAPTYAALCRRSLLVACQAAGFQGTLWPMSTAWQALRNSESAAGFQEWLRSLPEAFQVARFCLDRGQCREGRCSCDGRLQARVVPCCRPSALATL